MEVGRAARARTSVVRARVIGAGLMGGCRVQMAGCIRNTLVPAFGRVPVVDLTSRRLNEWARDAKVKARRGPDKGKMVAGFTHEPGGR